MDLTIPRFLTPTWQGPENVKAYITTRHSALKYEPSLSMQDEVKLLVDELNLPSFPRFLDQVHGSQVVDVNTANYGVTADAVFSKEPNKVCAVLTADCLPVLLCSRKGTEVAAAHAGWRGLAAGVIENTIAQFNTEKEDILVWLGPCIGPTKFEVGEDVYYAFVSKNSLHTNAFIQLSETKWLANLYQLAKNILVEEKIKGIYHQDYCTYSQHEWFCSYRRENKAPHRLVSLIYFT